MMRKVLNNGVNAINSSKRNFLIFFSLRWRTPVSFLNNQRFSARYFPVNRCFGLLWILNYFSGSGCCLGVLHHQEPGIQGGDKLFWDYKKILKTLISFFSRWRGWELRRRQSWRWMNTLSLAITESRWTSMREYWVKVIDDDVNMIKVNIKVIVKYLMMMRLSWKVSHPEPTEWRLDISQVKRRDAGWYMCQVSQVLTVRC